MRWSEGSSQRLEVIAWEGSRTKKLARELAILVSTFWKIPSPNTSPRRHSSALRFHPLPFPLWPHSFFLPKLLPAFVATQRYASTYTVICIPTTRYGSHEYGCGRGSGCSSCSLAHRNFGGILVGISGRKRSSYYTRTVTWITRRVVAAAARSAFHRKNAPFPL